MRRPLLPVTVAAAALALALAAGPGWPAGTPAGEPAAAVSHRGPVGAEQGLGHGRSRPAKAPRRGAPAGGDLAALRAEMIDAAMGIMAAQETLLDLEHELAALQAEEAARRGALDAERGRLAALLGGLQRLARVPRRRR